MGRGDKKTEKGKRFMGSYGISRKRKKKKATGFHKKKPVAKKKMETVEVTDLEAEKPIEKASTKKAAVKKTSAKKTAAKSSKTKKTATKKPAEKKSAKGGKTTKSAKAKKK